MLFQTKPRGKYYAARIMGRQEDLVKLKWHEGNVYFRGEKPSSPIFRISVKKCVEERQNVKDYSVTGRKVCVTHAGLH